MHYKAGRAAAAHRLIEEVCEDVVETEQHNQAQNHFYRRETWGGRRRRGLLALVIGHLVPGERHEDGGRKHGPKSVQDFY